MAKDRQDDRTADRMRDVKGNEELDRELQREQEEGRDLIGDTAEDRHVSGSSTYETLPDQKSDVAKPEQDDLGTTSAKGRTSGR